MIAVGFEPTPPERLEPKSSALDHSATLPIGFYLTPDTITPTVSKNLEIQILIILNKKKMINRKYILLIYIHF